MRPFPGLEHLELLPYHCFAEAKYRRLERKYRLEGTQPPPREQLDRLVQLLADHGVQAKAG